MFISIFEPPVFAGGSQVRFNEVSDMCVTVRASGALGYADRKRINTKYSH